MNQPTRPRANYGLDAPGAMFGLLGIGTACVLLSLLFHWMLPAEPWGRMFIRMSPGLLIGGSLMFLSSRFGKLRARDRLLDSLKLRGDERVLDVGCGHGLLLLGAAKRLPLGHAVGVDLWSQVDQGRNSAAATLANARAEGVSERVEVVTGDMRELPFPDATFDAIVSSLAIHNVPTVEGRRQSIREIARVLKPGGQVALLDLAHVGLYARILRESGLIDLRVSGFTFWIFPPCRTVWGIKK